MDHCRRAGLRPGSRLVGSGRQSWQLWVLRRLPSARHCRSAGNSQNASAPVRPAGNHGLGHWRFRAFQNQRRISAARRLSAVNPLRVGSAYDAWRPGLSRLSAARLVASVRRRFERNHRAGGLPGRNRQRNHFFAQRFQSWPGASDFRAYRVCRLFACDICRSFSCSSCRWRKFSLLFHQGSRFTACAGLNQLGRRPDYRRHCDENPHVPQRRLPRFFSGQGHQPVENLWFAVC